MGVFSKLFKWGSKRAQAPSAKQQARADAAAKGRTIAWTKSRTEDWYEQQGITASAGGGVVGSFLQGLRQGQQIREGVGELLGQTQLQNELLEQRQRLQQLEQQVTGAGLAQEIAAHRLKIKNLERQIAGPPTGRLEHQFPSGRFGTTGHSIIEDSEQGDELAVNDATSFLAGKMIVMADSSNVAWFGYAPRTEELTVGYKAKRGRPERAYVYSNVSRVEAAAMFAASSKGTYVWDVLRIRGTVYGHKKPHRRIR